MASNPSGGSGFKIERFSVQILFTIISIAAILIFKNVGVNKFWFEKTASYWDAFKKQKKSKATVDDRKRERWGPQYALALAIQKYFNDNNIKDPVVLVEPKEYLQKNKILDFGYPEPVVFYFYSGIRTVWMSSPRAKEANHVVYIGQGGTMHVEPVRSAEELQQILDRYKDYHDAL